MKNIILTAALTLATIGASATPAHAGGTCYPPTYSRSGNYVTYGAYGVGAVGVYHRVRVYYNGKWTGGPWISGNGYSWLTLYHPDRYGTAICQVYT